MLAEFEQKNTASTRATCLVVFASFELMCLCLRIYILLHKDIYVYTYTIQKYMNILSYNDI